MHSRWHPAAISLSTSLLDRPRYNPSPPPLDSHTSWATTQMIPPMAPQAAALAAVVALLLSAAPSAHGQAASAPAPAAAAPKTITAVLTKAGQFTKFLQLLRSTQEEDQITNQLKGKSSAGGGLTVFAPPDNAFSALPAGTLNSLSDQQKTSLVQFHVVAQLLPAAQLDTVSNPLRTQAGDTGRGKYPLNITSDGAQQVNVSTGVVNATVDSTLYSGDRLVVYQVSKVLLPWALYGPPVPAPAPSPADRKKKKAGVAAEADAPVAEAAPAGTTASEAGEGRRAGAGLVVAVVVVAAMCWGM